MADFRQSVGYLQLKAADQARQRAITDATVNQVGQDTDIGGKALGVVQQQVQRGQHVEDREAGFQNAQTVAHIGAEGLANRLMLKSSMPMSEKDQAIVDNYRSQIADRTVKQGFAGRTADRNDSRLRMDAAFRDHMAALGAAGADARQYAAAAAAWAAGMDPEDRPAPPVTVAPGAITQAAQIPGSGPAPTASQQDPNIRPSAQPTAPDAAQNPATAAAPPPAIGGYNPQPPPTVDTSDLGARIDKTTRDKLLASNQAAQELAPVLADAIAKFKATKPTDFLAHSAGGSARGALGLVSGKAPGVLDVLGKAVDAIAPEDAQRRQDAVGAVQLFRSKFNQSVSGMTVTEAEDTRLKSALGQLGESIWTGDRDQQIKALEEMERVRGEIYTRNDQSIKSGHLPKDFAFKGNAAPQAAAPQTSAPRASQDNPTLSDPDAFFDDLVAHGMDEQTAKERTKKQFGIK